MNKSALPVILIVVTDEGKADRLRKALEPDGYCLETIITLEGPLPTPDGAAPDLAILWFPFSSPEALPSLENIVAQILKLGNPLPPQVLLIIDQYGSHWIEPGFRLGITDILTRPIHPLILRQRVRQLLQARKTEQAEERFRTIADFTYDWEYWSNNQGDLIYNSPACERITGLPSSAFIENPCLLLDIVHPASREQMRQHQQDELSTREIYSIDYRILTTSGEERWIGHACQPVYSSDGRKLGRRVSNRDITQRKQAEQALLRAERLAAIGRLLASLAHEINNPLQAMSASMELVMNFPLSEDERQRYLQAVLDETERLMKISRGILDFARPARAELQTTSISSVIDRALFLARQQLKTAQISVEKDVPDNLPEVLTSPDQLSQVCLNLIINAAEHMPTGGCLKIGTRLENGQVLISFSDSGEGIMPDVLELIFEPFYTTKKDGTGLGLAISQSIMAVYGGKITAASTSGNGSIFTIYLPVSDLPSPTAIEKR